MLRCMQLARMFKVAPGLGFFSHQAQTHVFAASSNATGADAVLTRIISSRASVMVFWVDKLPPALVEALEAAVKLVGAKLMLWWLEFWRCSCLMCIHVAGPRISPLLPDAAGAARALQITALLRAVVHAPC